MIETHRPDTAFDIGSTLWCVHAPGDDYVAVPSYAAGVRFAAEVLAIVEHDFPGAGWEATVVKWPWDAAAHQRHLDEDRWPVDYDQHPPQLHVPRPSRASEGSRA